MRDAKNAFWFIVVAVFASFLFILSGYFYYSSEKKAVQKTKHAELSAIGKLKTDQFVQWHKERLSEANFFSGSSNFVSAINDILAGDTSAVSFLRKSLLHIMSNDRYDNIFLVDINGSIVFSTIESKSYLDSVSLLYCNKVFETAKLIERDYYYCPFHKSVHYEMFAPVNNPLGHTLAVMVFSINPNKYIYPLLSDWPNKSKTSESILVRNEVDSIRFLNSLKKADNSKLNVAYSVNNTQLTAVLVFSGKTGLHKGHDYAGDHVLADLTLVPNSPYALINKIDIEELFADFYKQKTMIVLITLLCVLLASSVVAWFYNQKKKVLYLKLISSSNKLKDSQEQYRLIMDNSIDAIMLTSPDGDIYSVNKAAEKMFGMSEKDICQKGRSGIVDENDPAFKKFFEQRNLTGSAKGEITFVHKDGTKFIAEISSSLFYGASGRKLTGIIIRDISERRAADLLLLQERKLLRTLIDSLPDSIFVKDNLGRKLISNKADLNHMRFDSENDALGKTDLEIFNSTDGEEGYREDMEVISSGKSMINKEVSFVDAEGERKWQLISKVPLFDQNNKINGLVGFSHDFTLRKEMELKLKYSEETIRLLFNSTAEGIYGLDVNGMCTFCNKSALLMLGFESEDEVLGKNMHQLIGYCVDNKNIKCNIANTYLKGEKSHSSNGLFMKKGGSPLPVEYWAFPIERDNTIIGAVVTFVDITERKHHENVQRILYEIAHQSMVVKSFEELLMQVKEQLGTELDATNFYVAKYIKSTNTLKQIVFINEAVTSDEWPADSTLSGKVINNGESILMNSNEIQKFYKHRKNDQKYIMAKSWLGVPIRLENDIFGVMVVQSYQTENAYTQQHCLLLEMIAHELENVLQRTIMINNLIEAKNKAEESDRLKSAFLANVSHEIRTPMNGILGFLDLLTEPNLSDNKKEMYLDIMNKSGQRLLETINDIIELSRIESGQLTVYNSEVNIAEIMNYLFKFFKHKAEFKGLNLQLDSIVEEPFLLIQADKAKLNGILINLLNNALKYTDSGSINFGCYFEKNAIVFYVKDTGIGIPNDKQSSVFDRFIQVDSTLTRQKEGAGLGLSIVKAYIQIMKGQIWLQSELGKGSCFYFSIPIDYNSMA